jgi:hypothetical protein
VVRDLGRYLWRLAQGQTVATISTVLGFVLTVAAALAGHPIGLPAWAWALLGEAALIAAGFLDWRGRRAVGDDHAAWLKQIAETVHGSIASDAAARYGDGHQRTEFRQHFPELSPLLDEWDSLPALLTAARRETEQAIGTSASDRWAEWPWVTIASYAVGYVSNQLRNTDPLLRPHSRSREAFPNTDCGSFRVAPAAAWFFSTFPVR